MTLGKKRRKLDAPIQSVGVVLREESPEMLEIINRLADWLERRSISMVLEEQKEESEPALDLEAYPVDDAEIRDQIAADFARRGRAWCPHTATGLHVYDQLPPERRSGGPWIVVATAHPAKFDNVVESVIGEAVPVPVSLATLLALPTHCEALEPELSALADVLDDWK